MTRRILEAVLRHFRRTIHGPRASTETDGKLLERFVVERNPAVFTTLVERHAAMVLGVARRILHDVHDADDVFQATFLVLAMKAGSIRRRQALAGWLFQVTHRLALKVRSDKARRKTVETHAGPTLEPAADTNLAREELRFVLDEELSQCPAGSDHPISDFVLSKKE